MRILYIFPHPDDESFGPALAMARQRKEGCEVHLLTLTRGGATKQRHRFGLSVAEMGRVRLGEMENVRRVLGLSGMTVLDFPDSGLKEIDPRGLEDAVRDQILQLQPDVLVTYAVHGVSGFHDHLVTHAVVKRVYCELQDPDSGHTPRRLALFTLAPSEDPVGSLKLHTSTESEIDCAVPVTEEEVSIARQALDCYESYQEVIRELDPLERVGTTVYFELFQESHAPWLTSLIEGL